MTAYPTQPEEDESWFLPGNRIVKNPIHFHRFNFPVKAAEGDKLQAVSVDAQQSHIYFPQGLFFTQLKSHQRLQGNLQVVQTAVTEFFTRMPLSHCRAHSFWIVNIPTVVHFLSAGFSDMQATRLMNELYVRLINGFENHLFSARRIVYNPRAGCCHVF
jgi:hypothetical protein